MIKYVVFLASILLSSISISNGESTEDSYTKNNTGSVEGNMTCNFKINELDKTSNFNYGIDKKMMSERNYQYAKNNCPYYDDGKWNENKMICEIDDPKEKAAYEDHICDEQTAKTEYPTIC